jgi:hypothetical protein
MKNHCPLHKRYDSLCSECKTQASLCNKAYYKTHAEAIKVRVRAYLKTNAVQRHTYEKTRYKTERRQRSLKKFREKLKYDAIFHYSHGTMKCACCSEDNIKFLTIDHPNGGGEAERKRTGHYGNSFYQWLRTMKYPDGYQVLCFNCNLGRECNGGICPHKV